LQKDKLVNKKYIYMDTKNDNNQIEKFVYGCWGMGFLQGEIYVRRYFF